MNQEINKTGIEELPISENKELPFAGKVVLLTGASRGLGAEIAKCLCEQGAFVVGPHRDPGKNKRAEKVIAETEGFAGDMIAPLADITTPQGRNSLVEYLQANNQSVDIIIHNAAGGMEENVDEEYAYEINSHAKVQLTRALIGMNKQSPEGHAPKLLTVVDIPSLWSQYYGQIEQLPDYELIAKTKHHGDIALKETIKDLQGEGSDIRFLQTCAHVIGDSTIGKLFKRKYPEKMTEIEKTTIGGVFPLTADVAKATVRMLSEEHDDGYIEFVGIPHWDKETVKEMFSMYGENALFVDDIVFFGDQAFATFRVPEALTYETFKGSDEVKVIKKGIILPFVEEVFLETLATTEHTNGHFTKETGISLLPGHKQTDLIFSGIQQILNQEPPAKSLLLVQNIEFLKPVFPGDTLRAYAETEAHSYLGSYIGSGYTTVNNEKTCSIESIESLNLQPWEEEATKEPHMRENQMLEAGAQVLGALALQNRSDASDILPLLTKIKDVLFDATPVVHADDTIHITAQVLSSDKNGFLGNATVKIHDLTVADIGGIECAFRSKDFMMKFMNRAKRERSKESQ